MKTSSTSMMGVAGAVMWTLTIFLRDTDLMNYPVARYLLGSIPNFGAVWLAYSLILSGYEHILKQRPKRKLHFIAIGMILALLFISEIIHDVFLNAPFDVWDMAASFVAAILLLPAAKRGRRDSP